MTGTLSKRCDGWTDRQTDVYTEIDCIIINEASCDAIQLPTLLGVFEVLVVVEIVVILLD